MRALLRILRNACRACCGMAGYYLRVPCRVHVHLRSLPVQRVKVLAGLFAPVPA